MIDKEKLTVGSIVYADNRPTNSSEQSWIGPLEIIGVNEFGAYETEDMFSGQNRGYYARSMIYLKYRQTAEIPDKEPEGAVAYLWITKRIMVQWSNKCHGWLNFDQLSEEKQAKVTLTWENAKVRHDITKMCKF